MVREILRLFNDTFSAA